MKITFNWFVIFGFGLASVSGVMQNIVPFETTNICVDLSKYLFMCDPNIWLNPAYSCISF